MVSARFVVWIFRAQLLGGGSWGRRSDCLIYPYGDESSEAKRVTLLFRGRLASEPISHGRRFGGRHLSR